jgi:hypothetical protein
MKENNNTMNKLNPNKVEIIKVKRDKEINKKIEQKIIPNPMEIPVIQTIDLEKNEPRNITTAPNKNGVKQKKNYKHLKITAKNKETKDTNSSNASSQKFNYIGVLLNKKMLGRSLPKNCINNGVISDIPNNSSNNIKRVISSNNIIIVNNSNGNDNSQKIKNINAKNNSNGFKNINKKNNHNNINLIREFRENKFINKNNNQIKKNNQQKIINENTNQNRNMKNNLDIKIINKKICNNSNNKIRANNSFNNSSNGAFNNRASVYVYNEGKPTPLTKNKTLKFNHLQIMMANNVFSQKTKRSMSSSINIPRNKLKQLNNQELMNGFVIYPDNELIKSTNNNAIFCTILENDKINKNKMKKINEQEKNPPKKKNNLYQYLILKGNASYLIRNCM